MNLDDAMRLARKLMNQYGLEDWRFGFNSNQRRAGVCKHPFPVRRPQGAIELSRHFTRLNTDAEVLDTILHEIAHAVVGPGHGHDHVWKSKCVEIGAKPERCYDDSVKMPAGKWAAQCSICQAVITRTRKPDPRTNGRHYHKVCGPKATLYWRENKSSTNS